MLLEKLADILSSTPLMIILAAITALSLWFAHRWYRFFNMALKELDMEKEQSKHYYDSYNQMSDKAARLENAVRTKETALLAARDQAAALDYELKTAAEKIVTLNNECDALKKIATRREGDCELLKSELAWASEEINTLRERKHVELLITGGELSMNPTKPGRTPLVLTMEINGEHFVELRRLAYSKANVKELNSIRDAVHELLGIRPQD